MKETKNETALAIKIATEISRKGIRFGECCVTLHFHDGRVSFYTLTTTERHNTGGEK